MKDSWTIFLGLFLLALCCAYCHSAPSANRIPLRPLQALSEDSLIKDSSFQIPDPVHKKIKTPTKK